MNKKIVIVILLLGIIVGILLSKISKNEKNISNSSSTNTTVSNNTTKTETNESSNTTNTIKSENNTTKNENTNIKNSSAKNTNTTKTENNTSKNESNTSTKNTNTENAQTGLSKYKAVWQYPDSTYPENEFIVKSINDNEVNFDFIIEGITTFENASATISENTAKFDIKNEGDWNIKGTITFDDDKVIFDIKESSSENIPTESITFKVKSNKSAF